MKNYMIYGGGWLSYSVYGKSSVCLKYLFSNHYSEVGFRIIKKLKQ